MSFTDRLDRSSTDFVAHAGANTKRIALEISGASALRLDSDGALVIATPAGDIRWKKPEVYQLRDGVRQAVAAAFALRGKRVEFALGAYDRNRDLVIDPAMTYASYLGGSDNEASRGVAVDSAGNIYVTGYTISLDLPHRAAPFSPPITAARLNPISAGMHSWRNIRRPARCPT